MIKLWSKFFSKKEQPWKTDFYFGIIGDERYRGHLVASGAIIVDGRIVEGEIYYLRDICGNILINKDEGGYSLI